MTCSENLWKEWNPYSKHTSMETLIGLNAYVIIHILTYSAWSDIHMSKIKRKIHSTIENRTTAKLSWSFWHIMNWSSDSTKITSCTSHELIKNLMSSLIEKCIKRSSQKIITEPWHSNDVISRKVPLLFCTSLLPL